MGKQRQAQADRDHASNFSQYFAWRRMQRDFMRLTHTLAVGQPGMRTELNFIHC